MSINIWTDSMQHAALLGKPVLFTNWLIQRDIIPDGWYCYDLRGTHKSPSTRTTLVDHAADYHAGTVLSPIPLKHEGTASRRVNGTFYLLGEEMTLEQFCEEHDLAYPQDNREFVLRPASLDEVGLFYSEEKLDEALGTVGHLRMDFGHGEKEFWHTWWPHNEDRFNTPEFKEVLQRFVDDLRQTGLLKNLGAMDAYCWQHGGSITEDRRSYGYIAETENYRFCLRCTPFPGEYQGYLYCYDLCQQEMYRQEHPVVGRVTFASGEQQEFTDSKALLQAIREELPFRSTTGFRFETLTDDPEVKKAVDDILLDFAGEDNSRRTCNYGLTETGKQALRKAADPSIPHTYAWFVMADTNTPQEIIRQDLTLEEAIQIYQDSNTSEKRLGVITLKGTASGNCMPSILCLNDQGGSAIACSENVAGTLRAQEHGHQPLVFENHGIDARYTGPHSVAPTMSARYGTGGNNVPLVAEPDTIFCITGNAIDRQPMNGGNGIGYQQGIAYTLTATDHHAVFSRQRVDVFKSNEVVSTQSARQHKDATDLVVDMDEPDNSASAPRGASVLLIRRLTPLECERLQGFPDGWTDIEGASDSARYKALGNSVAIPCVDYVLQGIAWATTAQIA